MDFFLIYTYPMIFVSLYGKCNSEMPFVVSTFENRNFNRSFDGNFSII